MKTALTRAVNPSSAPMAEVVKALTQRVRNRKGEKFSVGEAKTAYVYLVKNGKAPGKIEKLAVVEGQWVEKGAFLVQLARERLRLQVARAREGEHLAPLIACDLSDDVRGRAEPV